MGDGRFTALHGGNVASFARIEHVLSFPGLASRGAGAGAESGLQRLEAGRTVLLMDAGPPPAPAQNEAAHAGALSFEMSDEHERVVVNVGGGRGIRRGIDARVATAVRVTAAHSTLTLADTNQSLIAAGKPLGAGVDSVEVERDETDQGTLVTAVHDGYQRRFGLMHRRRLFLSPDGRDVRGEDRLMPGGKKRVKAGLEVALRFHLAPGTDITPTADMRGALLRLPSGALWQLKTDAGTVSVDESLWIGEEGRALRTRQIVIADETVPDGWRGRWSFKKMG
nr:heparinase II/III-family protein [Pacificimonas flava]